MNRIWFDEARFYSRRSVMRYKVGAVFVYPEAEIAGFGCNEFHETKPEPPYSLHAEIAAALSALDRDYQLRHLELYVYREQRNGVIADSKPCRWCQRFLRSVGVTTVYYTAKDGPHHRTLDLS